MRSSTKERIRRSLRGCSFKISLALLSFEDEYTLNFFGYLIALPFLDRFHRPPEECLDRWGFYFYEKEALVLCWGNKSKHLRFPWTWDHCKTEVLREDGTWGPFIGSWEKTSKPDGRRIEEATYTYVLKSGEVQFRLAKFYTERRTWRWKCLKHLPSPKLVRTSIDIEFDGEVGERTGSWKGGTVGCGYDLLPGETPLQCLRRMEKERVFN